MSRRSGPAEDRMRRLGGIAPVPMAAQQLKGQLWLTWARTCAVRQPAVADDLPVLRELDSEEPERRRWMGEDRLGQLLDRRAPIVTDPPVGRHPRVSLAPQLAEDRRLARSPRPQHQPRGSQPRLPRSVVCRTHETTVPRVRRDERLRAPSDSAVCAHRCLSCTRACRSSSHHANVDQSF